jgi:glycerol-3-phosphate dehydrogenase
MSHKVTVIGDGGWGTALAMVLQRNGHQVTIGDTTRPTCVKSKNGTRISVFSPE